MQFKFCWLLEFKQISLIILNISLYLYILNILAYFKLEKEQKIFLKKPMLSNIQFWKY